MKKVYITPSLRSGLQAPHPLHNSKANIIFALSEASNMGITPTQRPLDTHLASEL